MTARRESAGGFDLLDAYSLNLLTQACTDCTLSRLLRRLPGSHLTLAAQCGFSSASVLPSPPAAQDP